MRDQMGYSSEDGTDGTSLELTIRDVCKLLTFDTVFLSGEGERYESGRGEQSWLAGVDIMVVAIANLELNIL